MNVFDGGIGWVYGETSASRDKIGLNTFATSCPNSYLGIRPESGYLICDLSVKGKAFTASCL